MVIRYSRLRRNKYRTYKFLSSKLLFALKTEKSAASLPFYANFFIHSPKRYLNGHI